MDDFRVGSVPPSEPYGDRHPYGATARKRQRQHHDEHGEQEDDTTDTFEASSEEEAVSAPPSDEIEDYYRPSEREPEE